MENWKTYGLTFLGILVGTFCIASVWDVCRGRVQINILDHEGVGTKQTEVNLGGPVTQERTDTGD